MRVSGRRLRRRSAARRVLGAERRREQIWRVERGPITCKKVASGAVATGEGLSKKMRSSSREGEKGGGEKEKVLVE